MFAGSQKPVRGQNGARGRTVGNPYIAVTTRVLKLVNMAYRALRCRS
jgi:hypothetical protein